MIVSPLTWYIEVDRVLAALLLPVSIAILISGLDDLFLDFVCILNRISDFLQKQASPTAGPVEWHAIPEKRLAIFVPCWNEAPVIGDMVRHNSAAINYKAFDIFVGAYPNDDDTLAAVRALEASFEHVHLAVCPHDGPTSKADCLNWIYQRMLLFEETYSVQFDAMITHDAEDLIHAESLPATNYLLDSYDMVQIPVLALKTPLLKITHGLYCDEFAEFQLKDMPARAFMGSFIPSNGVGTAYSRRALELLAASEQNRIFDPGSLTEDYENGVRLHRLGCRQIFLPPIPGPKGIVATREFFPSTPGTAIRQRTRWVMGIALQAWEQHGWEGGAAQLYWFWRDRKGLIGNPLTLAANLLCVAGAATWIDAHLQGHPWGLEHYVMHSGLIGATLSLQFVRITVRMLCVQSIYGLTFALGVPVRLVCGNYINALASSRAVVRYCTARLQHRPLVWLKTAHAYPSRSTLLQHKRRLREVLVGSCYIQPEQLEYALATKPDSLRLGEYLVQLGSLTSEELYEALSLQQSLPAVRLKASDISMNVARTLPRKVVQNWKVLPFRIAQGILYLASPEIPTDELADNLRGFTRMPLQFHLITPENFAQLASALL